MILYPKRLRVHMLGLTEAFCRQQDLTNVLIAVTANLSLDSLAFLSLKGDTQRHFFILS